MLPRRVGPYRLEQLLGKGGMGVVYAAWDERLDRRVALKQIRPEVAADSLRRERFRREARALARLDHPAIVRIHDLLETAEGDWLVLQYVEGPTLAELLRRGPLPGSRVVSLARDILGALEAAHARGLLHRDLKAENVVVAPTGHAMVLDFGLAKLLAPEPGSPSGDTLASTGGVVGTYRAMSPEQANGRALDARSDLFSLGVLLYEAATGTSPFLAATPVATLTLVCTHLQAPTSELSPALPEPLSALIDSLLEKDAERRPGSAGAALARLDDPPSTVAYPQPPSAATVAPAPYRQRNRRWPLAAGLLLVVVAGLLLAWRLRVPGAPGELLYVAAAGPEIGLGAGREEVVLAGAALQAACLRALASLAGVAALPPGAVDPGERPLTPRRLAQILAADQVVTATLNCQSRQCQAVLRRQQGSDGRIVASTMPFEVPLDDPHLLDAAVSTYLKPLFPERRFRPEASPLQVRGEDYQRYLRVQRSWNEQRPADLQPLLADLDRVRSGSPLFIDAYLLEASLEGYRAFQTRDPLYVEQAFNLIAQARRLAPADAQPSVSWFGVAMNTGRFDEAEKALHEIELRLPGDVRTLQRRALLREHQGDRRQALELLRTAVRRHPSAGFLTDLANMEMRQGEIPAARATLEELLRRVPEDRGGQSLLAGLELKAGDLERADALYSRMARSRPSFGVLSNLAFAQLLLRRYGEAAANYRAAYALAPSSYSASLNLGDAELLRGQPAAARALYRQALAQAAKDPGRDAPPALAAVAQAEAHLGRGPEAAATIERAVVAAPNDPEVAFYAALVYALIGETASATASAGRSLAGGINAGWFSLPWFDELRKSPEFGRLLGKAAAAAPVPR